MKVTTSPDHPLAEVTVHLSRRNLEQLVEMLNRFPESEPFLVRMMDNGTNLMVYAQEDVAHYGDRTPGAGFDDWLDPSHVIDTWLRPNDED
jgi:hypothetical protein